MDESEMQAMREMADLALRNSAEAKALAMDAFQEMRKQVRDPVKAHVHCWCGKVATAWHLCDQHLNVIVNSVKQFGMEE